MRIAINIALIFLLGVIRPCTGQQLQWNKLASGIWLAKWKSRLGKLPDTAVQSRKSPQSMQWQTYPFPCPKKKFPISW
jgi:hypothetical protein